MSIKRILLISRIVFFILVAIFSLAFVIEFSFLPLPENYFGKSNYEVFFQMPAVGNPSTGLNLTFVLLIITVLAILGFFIFELFNNKKKNLKAIFGFIGLAVLFFVSFFVSKPDIGEQISIYKSKMISAGLVVSLVSIVIVFVLIVISELKQLSK